MTAPRSAGGRPRDPATEEALLSAALKVLEREGYSGFTIEAVAKRAGRSKVTIYRRWTSAAELLLAALAHEGRRMVPPESSGNLRTDLKRFFSAAFVRLNGRIGLLLRSLVAEAQSDEKLRGKFREDFIRQRRAALAAILAAAQARGELDRRADLELLLDWMFGAMWYRLLIAHAPLNAEFVSALVDLAERFRAPVA